MVYYEVFSIVNLVGKVMEMYKKLVLNVIRYSYF